MQTSHRSVASLSRSRRAARFTVALGLIVMAGTCGAPSVAPASQRPLCPDPAPTDLYFYMCRGGMQASASKLLYDFSVDNLYRAPGSVERTIPDLFGALGLGSFVAADDPKLAPLLQERGTIEFTRLDESSGEFLNKGNGPQQLSLDPTPTPKGFKTEIDLPETVQGLYWHSPLHLELMFYKGHRPHFRYQASNGMAFESDVICASVTRERTRVVTDDPNHRHLMVIYQDCK